MTSHTNSRLRDFHNLIMHRGALGPAQGLISNTRIWQAKCFLLYPTLNWCSVWNQRMYILGNTCREYINVLVNFSLVLIRVPSQLYMYIQPNPKPLSPSLSMSLFHICECFKKIQSIRFVECRKLWKRMQVSPPNSDIIITQTLGKSLKRHLHQHWHACGVWN